MRKAAIRHGDPTTTGGFVIALSSTIHDNGKKVAPNGDDATCGYCKGAFKIFGTGKGMSEKGRSVVIDGDPVLCPCKRNRVVVGSHPGIFLETDDGATRADAAGKAVTENTAASDGGTFRPYDERIRVIAPMAAHVGYPYLIETVGGQRLSGRIDSSGLLPRIVTGYAAEYIIYWGDEALARIDSLAAN